MTTKTDDLQDRVFAALLEPGRVDIATALSVATGVFVSLTLSYMRSQGHDVDIDHTSPEDDADEELSYWGD